MAGAFSGHLVNSFYQNHLSRLSSRPFNQFIDNSPHPAKRNAMTDVSNISIHGPISFDPSMHGTPAHPLSMMSFSSVSQRSLASDEFNPTYMDMSEATAMKIASLQAKLNQKLGPEYISQRPGPGGGPKLTYVEGWKIINLANEVFGFNGWSSSVISLTTDFCDFHEESKRYNVGVTAIVRVTLRDGVFHEDTGYGLLENSKSKGGALDKCKKEAVTDALKRALRNFGSLLGNCLYDKAYAQEVVKIKVPPPKFDKSELHRRPEFEESKPTIQPTLSSSIASPSTRFTCSASAGCSSNNSDPKVKVEGKPASLISAPSVPKGKQASAVPPHVRQNMTSSSSTSNCHVPTSNMKGSPVTPHALGRVTDVNAPITTAMNSSSRPAVTIARQSNISPPPARIRDQRKVTFVDAPSEPVAPRAESTPIEGTTEGIINAGEDSFHFSDDDAFLAMVDLGEGDLGRPIDFDEGIRRTDSYISEASFTETEIAGSSASSVQPSAQSRHQDQFQLNPTDLRATSGSSTMLTKLIPQKPPRPQSRQQSAASNKQAQQHHNLTANNAGSVSARQNENVPITPLTKRPSTPSVGGFRFPSGMNPVAQDQNTQHPTMTSSVGMKRSDTIQAQSARRPAQGMGLAYQQQPNRFGQGLKREILGSLEIGDGGDIKRPRR